MAAKIPLPDQLTLDRGTQNTLLRQVRVYIDRNLCDVLWAIHRLTNVDRPHVQIGVRQIANELRASESTARRAIRKLEAIGFISNDEVIGPRGRESNQYRIIWSEIRETSLSGRTEHVPTTHDEHCLRDKETGRWSRQTCEVFETSDVMAMAGEGQQELFGTDDAGPVNLTEPARSNRPGRSGQFDRAGQVNLTGPSLSHVLPFHSPSHSPPIQRPAFTIADADWLVVLDEMKIFGIWEDKAKQSIAFAQQKGLMPQTVSGLVRFAAGKVIARANDGTPLGQWHLPSPDNLDLTQQQPDRLYWWVPALVLARINRHSPWMGIATDWPRVTGERADEYNHAQAWLAEHAKQNSQQQTTHAKADEEAAKVKAFHAETARLEAQHADAIAALTVEQAIELLPSFLRRSQGGADPRVGRHRPHFLRLFAASLVPKSEASSPEST